MATRPIGAGLDTADCGYTWHGGNEERAGTPSVRQPSSSDREEQEWPPLSWLLSQSHTYVASVIGWPSFVPYVMVPRAAGNAHNSCAPLSKAAVQLCALCRFGHLASRDAHVSPAQAFPHSVASSRGRQIGLRLLQ